MNNDELCTGQYWCNFNRVHKPVSLLHEKKQNYG